MDDFFHGQFGHATIHWPAGGSDWTGAQADTIAA